MDMNRRELLEAIAPVLAGAGMYDAEVVTPADKPIMLILSFHNGVIGHETRERIEDALKRRGITMPVLITDSSFDAEVVLRDHVEYPMMQVKLHTPLDDLLDQLEHATDEQKNRFWKLIWDAPAPGFEYENGQYRRDVFPGLKLNSLDAKG